MQYFQNDSRPGRSPLNSDDRLQKAIARNRARMAKRQGASDTLPKVSPAKGIPITKLMAADKKRELPRSSVKPTQSTLTRKFPSRTSPPTRKVWNQSESQQSVEDRLEKLKSARKRRLAKNVETVPFWQNFSLRRIFLGDSDKPKWIQVLIKSCYTLLLCYLLVVIFGDRGAFDYYLRKSDLFNLKNEITRTNNDIGDIIFELNQIQNSTSYQRKMVRDYLGYISKDEHLVIFPESTIL